MTMAASFESVLQGIGEFRACASQRLQWAVLHERPQGADHVLAHRFEDRSAELLAGAEEAEAAGVHGGAAAAGFGAALDLGRSGAALVELHCAIRRVARLFHGELASPETFAALHLLATAEDSRPWAPWARSVAEALGQCRGPLQTVEDRIAESWAQWAEIACAASAEGGGAKRCGPARRGNRSRSSDGGHRHAG